MYNYNEYKKRFAEFMEDYNEIGASALAQYVAHRRIILDFLERAISRAEGAGGQIPARKRRPSTHLSDEACVG